MRTIKNLFCLMYMGFFMIAVALLMSACTSPEIKRFNELEGEWEMISIRFVHGFTGDLPQSASLFFFQNEGFEVVVNSNEGKYIIDGGEPIEFRYTLFESREEDQDFFELSIYLDIESKGTDFLFVGPYRIKNQGSKRLTIEGELRRGNSGKQVEITLEKK